MDRAAELGRKLGQVVQVQRVVFVGEEASATVVAALDQVQRNAWKGKAGTAGYGQLLSSNRNAKLLLFREHLFRAFGGIGLLSSRYLQRKGSASCLFSLSWRPRASQAIWRRAAA
jgi:hypothetical protein